MTWRLFNPDPASSLTFEWVTRQFRKLSDAINNEIIRYEDLRFPATNLTLGASAPTVNGTYGWYEFQGNPTYGDYVFAQVQLPHAWREGSALYPHVHWAKTTSAAGVVNWQLDYRWVKLGEVLDASWTTLASETPSVSDGNTQYQHALTSLGEITLDGTEQISDMLICKLSRIAPSGTDYAPAAVLLEFDIHYEVDSFGSEFLYTKAGG